MLLDAVVCGRSLVFKRLQKASKINISSHQYPDACTCKQVLGYDANALYLSMKSHEMLCMPGKVWEYRNPHNREYRNPPLYSRKKYYTLGSGLALPRWTLRCHLPFWPCMQSCYHCSITRWCQMSWYHNPCLTISHAWDAHAPQMNGGLLPAG